VASGLDRENVEGSDIEHLVHFLDPDASHFPLQNAFPLIALAFSDEGETDLRERLPSVHALGTIPEIPVRRIDVPVKAESLSLIRTLVEGGVGRLSRFTSAVTAELAILRRERETLLENYRALEDAFQAHNWEPVAEIFAHDPYADPKDEGIGELLSTGCV